MGNSVKQPSHINDMIGTYEWKIDANTLSKMKSAPPGQCFYGPSTFTIGNTEWKITAFPNGTKNCADCFCLSIKLISLPSNWKNITTVRLIKCNKLNLKYTTIAIYEKNDSWEWPNGTLSLSSLSGLEKITFVISIRILTISSNTEKPVLYKLNNNNAFKKNQEIIWYINNEQLRKMKQSHYGSCFESVTNIHHINNIWYLKCVPKGFIPEDGDQFLLYLKLCALPKNISSINISWRIQIDALSLDTEFTSEFNYNRSSFVWNSKILSFNEFKSYSASSLQIKCIISVISLTTENEKEIKLNEYFNDKNNIINDNIGANKEALSEKEEAIKIWLTSTVELPQYTKILIENGFDDLDEMQFITMNELNDIGITKLGHKKRLFRYAQQLKNHNIKQQIAPGMHFMDGTDQNNKINQDQSNMNNGKEVEVEGIHFIGGTGK